MFIQSVRSLTIDPNHPSLASNTATGADSLFGIRSGVKSVAPNFASRVSASNGPNDRTRSKLRCSVAIAIIGSGFSGSLVAANLLRNATMLLIATSYRR
jgi:hypothetical protein